MIKHFFSICIIVYMILGFVQCGCYTESKKYKIIQLLNNEISDTYNIPCIFDIIQQYNPLLYDKTVYITISKEKLLKSNEFSRKRINDFYEYTLFTKAYLMKYNSQRYLILVGQPAGASGLGVDYWYYECFEGYKQQSVLDFSSLIKTPYSVFYDTEKKCIGHIEVSKELATGIKDAIYTSVFINDKQTYRFIVPQIKYRQRIKCAISESPIRAKPIK